MSANPESFNTTFEEVLKQMYNPEGESGLLDVSYMYDASTPIKSTSQMQARTNAALIASAVNRSRNDPATIYRKEYDILQNLTIEDQAKYAALRVREEGLTAMQDSYERYIRSLSVPTTAAVTGDATVTQDEQVAPTYMGITWEEFLASNAARTPQETVTSINGNLSGIDLARAEEQERMQLYSAALESAGYDIDSLAPWNSKSLKEGLQKLGWWVEDFLPGMYVYKSQKYDIGALDIAKINKMTHAERMKELKLELDKAVRAGADPVDLSDITDAYSGHSSAALTGTFQALDALDLLFFLPKAGAKAFRFYRKGRILRQYTTAPNISAAHGAVDVAARLSASVLVDTGTTLSDSAKGLDKVTAGMNASPFPWRPLEPAALDGVSHSIQRYIEDHRKLIHFYVSKAINRYSAETGSFLRPGEREAAQAKILSELPTGARVTKSTPFNVEVEVTIPNPDKFVSPEDLANAERRYDVWRDAYEESVEELDRFYDETKHSTFDPNPEWVKMREATKDKAKKEMDAAYRILTKGIEPDNIVKHTVWYQRDKHTGQIMGVLDANPLFTRTISPNSFLRTIDELLVPERTEVLARQERLGVLLKKVVNEVEYGLSRRQLEPVDAVIGYGSDTQRKFTALELINGIEVPGYGTAKLDKKQVAAYFKARDMMDAAHGLRSFMKYKELGFKGYSKQTMVNVPFIDEGVPSFTPKKFFVSSYGYRKMPDGTTTIVLPPANKIVDATGREGATVTSIVGGAGDAIKERVIKGQATFVQFEQPVRVGDEMFNYGLISPRKLKDITPDVLPYRTGYAPNILKAPYAVRELKKVKFDGRDTKDVYHTIRFFNSRREAEAWRVAQPDAAKYITDADSVWRITDPQYGAEVNDAIFTGLYEDYRGAKIPFGPNATDTPREGAFAAMERYMDNLAWTYPLNDWREGVLARYFNSVNDYLVTPNSLTSEFKPGLSTDKINGIIALRDYIQDQLSVVSGSEMVFSRWSKAAGEHIEDSLFWKKIRALPGGEKLSDAVRLKLLYGAENVDGYGYLRNIAFRVYLGFGNLSQLPVQASNMAVVFSLHPLNSLTVARRFLALRTVAFLNPADPSYEKIVRIAAKSALMKYDDFEPMVRAWHNSGWAYTTRSSADARMAMRGVSPGGEITKALRAADKLLLLPFTEGELLSRLYGFLDSYTRLSKAAKKAGRVVNWAGPDGVQEIIREASRVAFNYTAANRAWWQKGILSIPTQFMQVPAKFYEELFLPLVGGAKFKSQFTKAERVRMLLGQAFLFGSMGVPFMPYFKDALYEFFTREAEGGAIYPNITEEQLVALSGGFMDWMSSELITLATDTDIHPQLASRMALANGFDMLISKLVSGPEGWGKALLGAFGGVLEGQAEPMIVTVARIHGTQLGAGTFEGEDAFNTMMGLATVIKSWDNYQTARLWETYNAIMSEKGETQMVIDAEGEDRWIIYLKKMGIDTHERYMAAKLQQWNKKNNPEKEIKNAVDAARQLLMYYITNGDLKDPETAKKWSQEMYYIRESLSSEEDKEKFATAWSAAVQNEKTALGKAWLEYLEMRKEYESNVLAAPPLERTFIKDRVPTE